MKARILELNNGMFIPQISAHSWYMTGYSWYPIYKTSCGDILVDYVGAIECQVPTLDTAREYIKDYNRKIYLKSVKTIHEG